MQLWNCWRCGFTDWGELPDMSHEEINKLIDIIQEKDPKIVFEWGAGYSTLLFPQFMTKGSKWYAVEHDKEWFWRLQPNAEYLNQVKFKENRIRILFFPVTGFPRGVHGDYHKFQRYVHAPERLKIRADIWIIDGKCRKECLEVVRRRKKAGNIIIIHDYLQYGMDFDFRNMEIKRFDHFWIGEVL